MDLNWIFDILTSPWLSLLFLPLIGYHCWQNVYDSNDLNDAISKLATNEATIFIPNPQDINENLTIPANITLRFIKGGSLNVGKYSIRNATYKWTSSPAAVNEFYLTTAAGADPGLPEPPDVFEDSEVMRKATLGSLLVGEWNFGDNDTLGYETIYVRIAASADPDSKAEDYVEAAYKVTINGDIEAGLYQIFEGDGSVSFEKRSVVYLQWWGSESLEALDVKGGIHLYDRIPQTVVTFTIDDANAITDWPALFASKNVKATAFPATAHVVADSAPWLALQTAGWEIGSHSKTHTDLTTLTEEQLEDEIGGSKTLLESWGFNVRNFCAPYGEHNDLVLKIIRKYYIGHTGAGGYNIPPFPMDNLARVNGDDKTLVQLEDCVDVAVSSKSWMIVFLHAADAPKLTKIGDLIDYIQGLDVQILTVSAAEDLIGNLVDSQHFKVGGGGELIGKNKVYWRSAVPDGTYYKTWKQGNIIWNTEPSAGGSPGWICTTSGTFSPATDNTGDTADTSPIITGMTDTSGFHANDYVTVSAGFPAGVHKIIAKTATSITLDIAANATVADVTVVTPNPVFKAMANLAA